VTLRSARVRDFQSIEDAEVDFGDFTVLVGPSNSGKSAFLRALRACLRNTAVPANVRQGTAKALIDVTFDDATVSIERGKSLSTYRLGNELFTKSGRSVPDQIARAIRLPLIEASDATFAFQFDKPFLLSEPGSQAAQVLGSLTNVSLLHSAVREANRRRQAAQATLTTRKTDVERLSTQMRAFSDLPQLKVRLEQAERRLEQAQKTERARADLQTRIERIQRLEGALAGLKAVEPPDTSIQLANAEQTVARLRSLRAPMTRINRIAADLKRLCTEVKDLHYAAQAAQQEHADLLTALGRCPTCGADTSHPHDTGSPAT
jgi:exonuclease SbcC